MKTVQAGVSLVTQVGDTLRAAIESHELEPGRLYSVNALCSELGVSRTPVREALLGLADAGLVRVERNRGFTVVLPSEQYIRHVFEVRILLEARAARHAATLATSGQLAEIDAEVAAMVKASTADNDSEFSDHDVRFHEAIMLGAANPVLADAVRATRQAVLALGVSTAGWSRTMSDIVEEHAPIVNALRAGDPDAAEAAMTRHLSHTCDLMVERTAAGAPTLPH